MSLRRRPLPTRLTATNARGSSQQLRRLRLPVDPDLVQARRLSQVARPLRLLHLLPDTCVISYVTANATAGRFSARCSGSRSAWTRYRQSDREHHLYDYGNRHRKPDRNSAPSPLPLRRRRIRSDYRRRSAHRDVQPRVASTLLSRRIRPAEHSRSSGRRLGTGAAVLDQGQPRTRVQLGGLAGDYPFRLTVRNAAGQESTATVTVRFRSSTIP